MEKFNGLGGVQLQVDQLVRELTKQAKALTQKADDAMKMKEFIHEKRGKFNKKPCNMQLCLDGSIRVTFDDPTEAKKIFE